MFSFLSGAIFREVSSVPMHILRRMQFSRTVKSAIHTPYRKEVSHISSVCVVFLVQIGLAAKSHMTYPPSHLINT